jgi:hypothetical protein
VSRPADIPAEARVRRILDQYLTECHDNGKRPSVLALATRLGMTNTTPAPRHGERPAPGSPGSKQQHHAHRPAREPLAGKIRQGRR